MSNAYDTCIGDAPMYQEELKNKLEGQESNDVITHYESVARSFPSTSENPHSLFIPLINHDALKLWAKDKGWDVKFAPEKANDEEKHMPPVRFTKIT